jgi:hypothetical protein
VSIDTTLLYSLKEVSPLCFVSKGNSMLRRVAKRNKDVVNKQEKITIHKHLNLNFIVHFNYYLSCKALLFHKQFALKQQNHHSEPSAIKGVAF